jgi:hypothetical protein
MLRVPSHLTFKQLHEVLQVAFDWGNYHLYFFEVNTIANAPTERHYVPNPAHIMSLETAEMMADSRDFMTPEEFAKMRDVKKVTLSDVFEKAEWRQLGVEIEYEYDKGDCWEHRIQFLGEAEPYLGMAMGLGEQRIFCFGGEGHRCSEDCGSDEGWESLKVSFAGLVW